MGEKELLKLERRPGESHSELAYRTLRENILQMRMAPGSVVNEISLAEQLNISRTPVHEAVGKLKEERLINVIPRRQSTVALIDISYINEGVFVRSTIEPAILRAAAGNLSSSQVHLFQENLQKQKNVLEGDSDEPLLNYLMYDDEFHRLIYQAANKVNIFSCVRNIVSHFDWIRYMVNALSVNGQPEVSYQEHQTIFNMLLLGIPEGFDLDAFCSQHIATFRKELPELIVKYPQYFNI